ncbi:TIGR02444 family protein [Brevundimonas sp.]|uniref:TIGR02444 family protein n=1 Tax=Brevundimonas sp. TaxID=1871086 RepID=UPI00261A1F51|nr:TIGR02444 family protein [Brevundimonas sp.]
MPEPDDTFWDWALKAYAAPGVPEACLQLQDGTGQNVPLLLWAGWTAATGRLLDEDAIEGACDCARAWDAAAVAPLRTLRRTLKNTNPDIDNAARESLRESVKAVELAAERHLMAGLEVLAPAPTGPPRPAIDALASVARVWSRVVPRPALTTLAERLPA